jgi:cell division transport system permease protein
MERYSLGYHFKEGFHSIFTHGFMSFAAVCMIVACLLIMGSFSLVAVNLDNMLGTLESENEFLAYIDESYTQEQIEALQKQIEAVPNVASATFVAKEEALNDFMVGREDLPAFDNLPPEVFRDRFSIHVVDIERIGESARQVEQLPGVANMRVELEVAQGFVTVRNIATGVALILVGILLIISLFIIANTIKLATFTRRDEIAIMKMCGATNWFIRWPFVFEGMLLGLFGAVVAFFLQWGIYQLIAVAINQADGVSFLLVIPFRSLALWVLGIFGGTGLIIGTGGSLLAIRKFLQV